MPKANKKLSPRQLAEKENRLLPFSGTWEQFLGVPEAQGTWIVYGLSYNGKTRFVLSLVKYIAELGEKVVMVSLEEGDSESMKHAFGEMCMSQVNRNVRLWYGMDIEDIKEELRKPRSPRVVVIDSLQYLGINYNGYKQLKEEFRNKLFVFVSHANEKGDPMGATAVKVRYDAMVKIRVVNFRARASSRYGGGEIMTIWEDGALRTPEGDTSMDNIDNTQ